MALVQPTLIPQPWGSDGQVGSIPQDSSEFGKASWAKGFPTETAQPLTEGGIPPSYLDFQGVLNILSAHAVFMQSGAQYTWSNSLDYPAGSIVLGSDGKLYQALQASGPGYPAGAKNPTASGAYWSVIPLASQIAALEQKDTQQDAAISEVRTTADAAVKKVDGESPNATGNVPLNNVVHRTGDETIAGVKTLVNYMQIQNDAVAAETWVSQVNNRYLQYIDKNGVPISAIQFRMTPTTNAVRFLARKPKDAESALSGHVLLAAEQDDNGNTRNYCTAPASNSNTNDIATTGWVIQKIDSSSTSSDKQVKDFIENIPEPVLRAWGKVGFKRFKYKDSIAEKGSEEARWHAGVIVQDVIAAFEEEGLDATEWGVVCLQHYDEAFHYEDIFDIDEDGNEIVVDSIKIVDREPYDVWGIRYNEALTLECAYQRWLGEQREARLAALETKLMGEAE